MKVFLDTNVLASAAATRGLCADVLREAFASHELIISEQVLKELRRVLSARLVVDQDLVDDFIRLVAVGLQAHVAGLVVDHPSAHGDDVFADLVHQTDFLQGIDATVGQRKID